MGEQVRELFNWARRRKILAGVFVAFTLAVGILIGSVVSGRTSAMKSLGFAGTTQRLWRCQIRSQRRTHSHPSLIESSPRW
jgi:hypothetical protein